MSIKNHDLRYVDQLRRELAELPADERYLIEEAGRMAGSHASVPDFIVIGAPRAGTTWLFELLRNHPDVFLYLAGANYLAMKGYKELSLSMLAAVKSSMHYNPNVENDICLVREKVSAKG